MELRYAVEMKTGVAWIVAFARMSLGRWAAALLDPLARFLAVGVWFGFLLVAGGMDKGGVG